MDAGDDPGRDSLHSLLRQLADVGEVAALQVGAGDRLGRYRLVAELGRGGFGVVFEARDLELPRSVAIKLLKPSHQRSDDAVRQFHREAEAVAGLNHPRIVTIHDFGSNGDVHFLVLELLRGETLAARLSRAPLDAREALDVAIAAAEGVACAHAAGLVHRDLKPSNVFLTVDDGLKLLDFGLARGDGDVAPQLDGAGTPEYMSPEQLRGQPADARSDVYALGLILAEMLAGGPAPSRLREVCARARADAAAARYSDAGALLAALQEARAAIARQKRARGWSVAAALIVVLAALGLGALLRARHREAMRVRLATEVGVEVRDIEAALRYSHLQPIHDIEPDEAAVRARLGRLRAKLDALGDFGEGAGELALGRGSLALHEAADAELHLEAAERSGYRSPEVSEALGLALGERYRAEAVAVDRLADPDDRAAARQELQARYRQPAIARLRAGGSSSDYALALIALYEQRYDDALALAERAFVATSWLYEAAALAGDVHLERARALDDRGRFADALVEIAAGRKEYDRALVIARSDPSLFRGQMALATEEMDVLNALGRDDGAAFAVACAAGERALRAAPHDLAALVQGSMARTVHALGAQAAVEAPLLDEAEALARRAVAQAPEDAAALAALAHVHGARVAMLTSRGGDTTAALAVAERSFARALQKGTNENLAVDLALLLNARVNAESDAGKDPTATVERLLAALEHAHSGSAAMYRGRALSALGSYQGDHGVDPHPTFARAAAAFVEAERLRPNHPDVFDLAGESYFYLGIYERSHGLDAKDTLARSIARSERALAIKPGWAAGECNLGVTLIEAAANELTHERDPLPLLGRARAALERAIALDPAMAVSYGNLALARVNESYWLLDHHRDASAAIAAGMDAIARSEALTRNEMANLPLLFDLATVAGRQHAAEGRSPLADFARARAVGSRLLALDPKRVLTHSGIALVLRYQSEWKLGHGRAREVIADVTEGERAIERAMAADPDNPEWELLAARLQVLHARALPAVEERRAHGRQAQQLFERANRRTPRTFLAGELEEARRLAE